MIWAALVIVALMSFLFGIYLTGKKVTWWPVVKYIIAIGAWTAILVSQILAH